MKELHEENRLVKELPPLLAALNESDKKGVERGCTGASLGDLSDPLWTDPVKPSRKRLWLNMAAKRNDGSQPIIAIRLRKGTKHLALARMLRSCLRIG